MHQKRSLILITIDCLRADHVGFLGYDGPTTPFLDSLSGESLIFERAIVGGTPTYFSFPAIMASRYPLAFGRDVIGLVPEDHTLASLLSKAGYITGGFVAGNPYLSHHFGYDQGFDEFHDFLDGKPILVQPDASETAANGKHLLRRRINAGLQKSLNRTKVSKAVYDELYFHYCYWINKQGRDGNMNTLRKYPAADVVVDRALSWVRNLNGGPFFLWIHLMDPHHPYYPPQEALATLGQSSITARQAIYLNRTWSRDDLSIRRLEQYREKVMALYDAGVRWADNQISRMADALKRDKKWDKTVLVVTADHGEEFLDHSGRYHYPLNLHEELIRVPLLIRAAKQNVAGQVESPFSLVDLVPTVLDALEVPAPDELRGQSCWTRLRNGESWDQPVITECVYACTNPLRMDNRVKPRLLSVRDARYKLVLDFSGRQEYLFDLEADAAESSPLSEGEQRAVRRRFLELAHEHLRDSAEMQQSRNGIRARLASIRHHLSESAVAQKAL